LALGLRQPAVLEHQRVVIGEERAELVGAVRKHEEHVGDEAGLVLDLEDAGADVVGQIREGGDREARNRSSVGHLHSMHDSMARSTAARPPVPELQLAALVDRPPEGPEWLHEQKFDGYRIVANMRRGEVQLLSRRFKDWTAEFPGVAAAVGALPAERAVLDGEVAAVLPDGRTSFQALQGARSGGNIAYFAFDLLALDDDDLTALPLEQRKARLAQLVEPRGQPGV